MLKNYKNTYFHAYFSFTLTIVFFLTLSRLALSFWLSQRVTDVDGWLTIFLQGLRVDIATLCLLLAIPLLISIAISGAHSLFPIWKRITQFWLSLLAFVFLYMEMATPSFIIEYNIRPNRLFIEYLIYPKEVFSMLVKSHLLELILITTASIMTFIISWNKLGVLIQKTNKINWRWRPLIFMFTFVFLLLGGRSTLGHRPLNPAMVSFSTDPLINSLILNSLYSTAFSAKQMLAEDKNNHIYGFLSDKKIIQTIRKFEGLENSAILNKNIPTLHHQVASYKGKKKNLVIILEESLGARFVGSLNGLPLTPNLDKLSAQGWFFNSMLATGTRSVRGIEAVITGFTPTPDRAVVKLSKSQNNFFTIAELLKRKGYYTEFIYGGEAHFDNMKSFFLDNGFEHITEEKDYINPKFIGSWGASDEDLFTKAHKKFQRLESNNQPFFSLVFTSSNHSPFEYPKGRIKPFDKEYHTRNNAVKYADWALGEFIKQAKSSNYWKDTIFLIIADHDANAGSHRTGLVPPKSFHIPALILGEGIEHKIDNQIVSQLDMPPTLLSLIGVDNENPMIGKDLTLTNKKNNRAIMQYGQNFALLENDFITVLQPHKKALKFQFNHKKFASKKIGFASKNEAEKALAISSWGKLAYHQHLYHLPKSNKYTTRQNKNKIIQSTN